MSGKALVIGGFGQAIDIDRAYASKRSILFETGSYMAPEILRNEKYDHKVDIWSFGCVLYEMVKLNKMLNVRNIIECSYKPPKYSGVSDDIEPLFEKILKKYRFSYYL